MDARPTRPRLESVDALRGLVMVLMALDHARDFFADIRLDPTDLASASTGLFLTRWVTHVCAPVFVFLAGASAWLWASRGRSRAELSRLLVTRGLWLVVLEFTVVTLGWWSTFAVRAFFLQVIAAIGVAMVVLAALVHLGRRAVLVYGLAVVLGHDALGGLAAAGAWLPGWLWTLLEVQGPIALTESTTLLVLYPLLPWTGVLALGYAFAPLLELPRPRRRRLVAGLGLALSLAFVLLRAGNLYGDPTPWSSQDGALRTLLSFVNCGKYPPSLCFLLMTLGPALALLAALDGARLAGWARPLPVFGRVPLFFYVAHLYLISFGAAALNLVQHGEWAPVFPLLWGPIPHWFGRDLWVAYVAWALVVALLFVPCRAYGRLKRTSRSRVLTYL